MHARIHIHVQTHSSHTHTLSPTYVDEEINAFQIKPTVLKRKLAELTKEGFTEVNKRGRIMDLELNSNAHTTPTPYAISGTKETVVDTTCPDTLPSDPDTLLPTTESCPEILTSALDTIVPIRRHQDEDMNAAAVAVLREYNACHETKENFLIANGLIMCTTCSDENAVETGSSPRSQFNEYFRKHRLTKKHTKAYESKFGKPPSTDTKSAIYRVMACFENMTNRCVVKEGENGWHLECKTCNGRFGRMLEEGRGVIMGAGNLNIHLATCSLMHLSP